MYYVYMLRCEDNTIYTGITNNLERRMEEHFTKNDKCAKYTKSHNAKKLETAWKTENKALACKLEYAIKTLKKEQKEKLICKELNIETLFEEKLESSKYKRIKNENNKQIICK